MSRLDSTATECILANSRYPGRGARTLVGVAAFVLLILGTSLLTAQQTPNPPNPPNPADNSADKVVTLEKYNVEESLEGQARAIQGTKRAINLVNIISADKMGTFPDMNAAEALRRLPGISLALSGGEGRYISIRGAQPQYNGTLVNGFTIPTGDAEFRRHDLATLSNALIDSIVVTKAAMPDLPSDGIGGITNIIMRNPVNLEKRTITASGFYGDNEYGAGQHREELSYGDFIGSKQRFAFIISGNRRDSNSFFTDTSYAVPTNRTGTNGAVVPLTTQVRYQQTDAHRYNEGYDIAFGAKLGTHTKLTARYFDAHWWNDQTVHRYTFNAIAPAAVNGVSTELNSDGGLVNATYSRLYRDRTWDLVLKGYQVIGTTSLPNSIELDYGFQYSNGYENYFRDLYSNSVTLANLGEPIRISLRSDIHKITPTGSVSRANMFDPSRLRIVNVVDSPVRHDNENERTAYLNGSKKFQMGDAGTLEFKTGAYIRARNKSNPQTVYIITQLATGALTFANLGSGGYFNNYDDEGIELGPTPSVPVARSIVSGNPASFGPPAISWLPGSPLTYYAEEDIQSGYAMLSYTKNRLNVIAGGRYESTDQYFRRTITLNGAYNQYSDSFDHFMPSVHLKYEVSKDMFLRASWSNTVARANAIDIYGTEVRDDVNLTWSVPNPGLESLTSSNIDASFDWYTGPLGQLMVGFFNKNLDNFPFTITDQVSFNNLTYRRSMLQANTSGKITGYEISLRRNLDFLPGPLSGLGVDINYAGIDSEVNSPLRTDKPRLPNQPEYVFNASVYFAYRGFFIRASLAEQGELIDSAGAVAANDRTKFVRSNYDLAANYQFGRKRNYQVFLEWRNITNEPDAAFFGTHDRLASRQTSGSNLGGGLRLRF